MANDIRIDGDVAYVTLNLGHVATVDVADLPLLEGPTWFAHRGEYTTYVRRQESRGGHLVMVYLHRALMGDPAGMTVDHCDLNGLNNRRANLRLATAAQNSMNRRIRSDNTTGFKGVYRTKHNRWMAKVSAEGECYYLGTFGTVEEANWAVQAKRAELHGVFERSY